MIDKEKAKMNMKKQWIKFGVVTALYLLFLLWVKSWLGLIIVPFIFDNYITKKIRWAWWKDAEGPVRFIMSWVDALVFALVAVYFINLFAFQNYVIPSSSLEKSLLTGDYLFVSKLSYGPRIPETPLTMPLTQHTLPIIHSKSYIEWPHWDYRRVKGLGHVKLNDIVVFNYPAGDTILTEEQFANSYYTMCYDYGMELYHNQTPNPINPATLNRQGQLDYFNMIYNLGRSYIQQNPVQYGMIDHRPTDRRENYVKRCVGLPGDTVAVVHGDLYVNGVRHRDAPGRQYNYYVRTAGNPISRRTFDELGIAKDDILYDQSVHTYLLPLTDANVEQLRGMSNIVSIERYESSGTGYWIFPNDDRFDWNEDNFGPLWIPKQGATVALTTENLPLYRRIIRNYEGNDLEVRDGEIYINGAPADSYTFAMDYYFMMGDNRHNSADSRFWGFVPEDHVVGKPVFIGWSADKDKSFPGKIRWNRIFSHPE